MPELPFDIPGSLASYANHLDEEPLKAITRLKEQLKKRGPDAVGHFLLAWFYHCENMGDKALEHALKAKIYAPGSPFLGKLHYYLAHPDIFDAWTPDTSSGAETRTLNSSNRRPEPVFDLNVLIEKLSEIEPERDKAFPGSPDASSPAPIEEENNVDDIVSETLAGIHETQGKTEAAIQTYKRLKKLHKEKRDFYRQKISRLQKLRDQQNDGYDADTNENNWDQQSKQG